MLSGQQPHTMFEVVGHPPFQWFLHSHSHLSSSNLLLQPHNPRVSSLHLSLPSCGTLWSRPSPGPAPSGTSSLTMRRPSVGPPLNASPPSLVSVVVSSAPLLVTSLRSISLVLALVTGSLLLSACLVIPVMLSCSSSGSARDLTGEWIPLVSLLKMCLFLHFFFF